ncbi:MAG: aspartate 1-decarboxylase [Clostridia bacterium]|nr:aspartate 1-decarboxylase [Clostridia bacterium]NCC74979.1 aspartate 1-decarboxylase [Clostridia bacterium]
MELSVLKAKIHRAVVTEADLHYVGSITIDQDLMDAAGLLSYEKVLVADIDNGNRLETYIIAGPRGSGIICLNGASARLVSPGDRVIVMAFCTMSPEEAKTHRPTVVFVDDKNVISEITYYEEHGMIG